MSLQLYQCQHHTTITDSEAVAAEEAVAARAALVVAVVTQAVEDVLVGSVTVLTVSVVIMEVQVVLAVMEAAEDEVLDITGMVRVG